MIVAFLLTCLFLALLHYYIVHFGRKGRLINRIPGLKTLPIIGNIHHGWRYSPEKLWPLFHTTINMYYPIMKFWIFTMPNVYISHPDDMEKMLSSTKHNVKAFPYKLLHPWLGDGLLTSKGTKWQKRRKMLTPSFHFSMLKQFVEVLIEEGNHAAESFNDKEESIIDNLQLFTSRHTLNAICETSMGISLSTAGSFHKYWQKYCETVHDMGKIVVNRVFKPRLLSDTIFGLTSMGSKHKKYLNILHSFTTNIIAERKRYHEQTGGRYLKHFENDSGNEEILGIKKRRMAMLDILIAESRHGGLSDLDIREEIDTFVFEGHDTVAIAVTFTLLLLAEHKDIQDRVRKEISEVMQENGKLNMNALQNLPYLDMCLKESLRMYPSVPIISRVCTEDVKLQSYLVPEGTQVHVLIYNLHHNPNVWPNPEVFDPDRFLPENIKNRHPYSYLPFSAGPRNCIGQRFAMLELKALIAPLVYNFHLEPVDYLKDVPMKMDFVLRAARPFRMKVIPIKRTQSSNANTD